MPFWHQNQYPWLHLQPTTWVRLAYCTVVLVAFALNLQLLDRFPLREDEAIYSVWALHSWQNDPLFLTVWPDKPPLFYWTLAPLLQLFGATGAGARWLNVALTTLTPLVIGAIARRLWQPTTGLVATLVMACNPFALSFAATVYTDPMLVLCGQLACYYALVGRGWRAGLWLGAAIMTKQQGVLYLPLVSGALLLAQGVALPTARTGQYSALGRTALHFGLGLILVIAPILYWDSLRWQVAPSPWDLSLRHYGAITLLAPTQWIDRLQGWWPLVWLLMANPLLWLVGTSLLLTTTLRVQPARHRRGGWLILLWSLGFLLLHLVSSVQIWDRYLLPLAPMVALLAAYGWHYRPQPQRRHWQGIGVALLLLLLPPAWTAAKGGLPLGGDHGAYQGLVEATAWLRTHAPTNVVIYHQALGWQAQFYFYAERATGAYELRWFSHPLHLAADAAKLPYRRRFLLQPQWSAMHNLSPTMTMHNLQFNQRYRQGEIVIYEITEQPQAVCTWCSCQPSSRWPLLAATTAQSVKTEKVIRP